MSKEFSKTKVGGFLTKTLTGKLLTGAADLFTAGTVSNVIEGTETSPSGKVDWGKLAGAAIVALLIILVATGKISIEQAEQLNDLK